MYFLFQIFYLALHFKVTRYFQLKRDKNKVQQIFWKIDDFTVR